MRRAVATFAAALAATACSYDFRNPAEDLGTGQALGRVVADRGAGFQPLDGTLVSLENSSSFSQVTRSSGRFTLLSLPIGQHRVLFRKGTQWAASRIVEIVPGEDGKPEGVNLGDVRLRYPVTVQGTVRLPSSFNAFSFSNLAFDVTDELSGQPAALSSAGPNLYQWSLRGLSTGEHRIRFVVAGLLFGTVPATYAAAPLSISIPDGSEGQLLTMNAVSLDPEPAGTAGSIRLRIQGVGPSGPAAAAGARVELHDALLDPTGLGTYVTASSPLAPDSSGFVQTDELPGFYVARIIPPPHGGQPDSGFWVEPAPIRILVRSGKLTDFGTIYLVDSFTGSTAADACFSDAECSAGACVDFRCQGGSAQPPPPVAPASTPFCLADSETCLSTPGIACASGFGQCQRDCSNGVTALTICAPVQTFDPTFSFTTTVLGQPCTLDGVTVLTGDTQFGSCPFN